MSNFLYSEKLIPPPGDTAPLGAYLLWDFQVRKDMVGECNDGSPTQPPGRDKSAPTHASLAISGYFANDIRKTLYVKPF